MVFLKIFSVKRRALCPPFYFARKLAAASSRLLPEKLTARQLPKTIPIRRGKAGRDLHHFTTKARIEARKVRVR
jgi:hypothetical protein